MRAVKSERSIKFKVQRKGYGVKIKLANPPVRKVDPVPAASWEIFMTSCAFQSVEAAVVDCFDR